MFVPRRLKLKTKTFSLRPDFIADSVKDINFAYMKRQGITTCFIDLDGTVVSRGTFEVDPALSKALLLSGMDIKIATNRPRSRDLKKLKKDLNASGVIHPTGIYAKPTRHYYGAALKEYGLHRAEVVMIGDRFFQDILGANRSGIYSLAVFKLGGPVGTFDRAISHVEKRFLIRLQSRYKKV